jgi:hypothetical protein
VNDAVSLYFLGEVTANNSMPSSAVRFTSYNNGSVVTTQKSELNGPTVPDEDDGDESTSTLLEQHFSKRLGMVSFVSIRNNKRPCFDANGTCR